MIGWLRRRRPEGGVRFAGEAWPWSRICKHVIAMGGTGSGKTYSCNMLIRTLMRAGCPMLFNCVKPDDYQRICEQARAVGHASRVVEICPAGPHRMNLMDSLLTPHGSPAAAAQLLRKIGEVGERGGGGGGDSAKFWETQGERATTAAISLCRAVLGRVTLIDAHAVVMSSPEDVGATRKPEWEVAADEDADGNPIRRGRCAQLIVRGYRSGLHTTSPAFRTASDYLLNELPAGGDRMRGGIIANVNNTLGRFIEPPWAEALSTTTTLTPGMIAEQGLIGVLNAPIMVGLTPARMFQFAWTMEAQRYAMARDASRVALPLVLVRDEVGWVLNPEWDAMVQIVARSQKLAMLDLVQDIDTLLMGIGGSRAQNEAYSFLTNHAGGKLLFGTDNPSTAEWMSKLIGQERQVMISGSGQEVRDADLVSRCLGATTSYSWTEQWQPIVRPEVFARLGVGRCVLVEGGRHRFVDLYGKG